MQVCHALEKQQKITKYNFLFGSYLFLWHIGCEKGETDHGVGTNEVAIWWEVSAGRKLTCREEMVSLLKTKFSRKSNSLYTFRIYIKL